jgi:antitoxin PrlF
MTASTVTSRGRITIPKTVRERMHLRAGDRVKFVVQEDGTVKLALVGLTLDQLKTRIPPLKKPMSLDEIDQKIRRHAVRRAHRR